MCQARRHKRIYGCAASIRPDPKSANAATPPAAHLVTKAAWYSDPNESWANGLNPHILNACYLGIFVGILSRLYLLRLLYAETS